MKNLKLSLFSLLILLSISVVITSCGKQDLETTDKEQTVYLQNENAILFILPDEIEKLSDEEIASYLENLTEEEFQDLVSSHSSMEAQVRSCGNWAFVQYFCMPWGATCNDGRLKKYKVKRRWCGPPNNGAYQYAYVPVGCCW